MLAIHKSRQGWLCYYAETVLPDGNLVRSPLSAFPYVPLYWLVTTELMVQDKADEENGTMDPCPPSEGAQSAEHQASDSTQ